MCREYSKCIRFVLVRISEKRSGKDFSIILAFRPIFRASSLLNFLTIESKEKKRNINLHPFPFSLSLSKFCLNFRTRRKSLRSERTNDGSGSERRRLSFGSGASCFRSAWFRARWWPNDGSSVSVSATLVPCRFAREETACSRHPL